MTRAPRCGRCGGPVHAPHAYMQETRAQHRRAEWPAAPWVLLLIGLGALAAMAGLALVLAVAG